MAVTFAASLGRDFAASRLLKTMEAGDSCSAWEEFKKQIKNEFVGRSTNLKLETGLLLFINANP